MFNRPSPSTISITLRAQIKGKIHLLRYLDNIYTLSNYGLLFIMPRWWLRLIPGLIIIYYVRVQACLTPWKSDIFLLICWTHYPMQWLFSWFYPKANTGSMKTTCFSLFAQLWLCNIGKYYWHIWTRWILNKALPTFLLFLITWELRLNLSFCVYSNRGLQWMHATLHY